jgi:hypothetical protein
MGGEPLRNKADKFSVGFCTSLRAFIDDTILKRFDDACALFGVDPTEAAANAVADAAAAADSGDVPPSPKRLNRRLASTGGLTDAIAAPTKRAAAAAVKKENVSTKEMTAVLTAANASVELRRRFATRLGGVRRARFDAFLRACRSKYERVSNAV